MTQFKANVRYSITDMRTGETKVVKADDLLEAMRKAGFGPPTKVVPATGLAAAEARAIADGAYAKADAAQLELSKAVNNALQELERIAAEAGESLPEVSSDPEVAP